MPWLETAPVDERIRFIQDALSDRFIRSELCARYGVSRRVGYQWLARYEAERRRTARSQSGAAPLSSADPPGRRRAPLRSAARAPPLARAQVASHFSRRDIPA
jgi:hypothetical protein